MKTSRLLSVFVLVLLVIAAGYPALPAAQASPPRLPDSPDELSIISVIQSPTDPRELTITGTDFVATLAASLDETIELAVTFVNDTTLTARVPVTVPPKSYTLKVTNPDPFEEDSTPVNLSFPAPAITEVVQTSILLRQIAITGTGFEDTPVVFLDDTALLSINMEDSETLTATVPASVESGSYTLKVVNPDGQFAQTPFVYTKPGPAPIVTQAVPQPTNLRVLSITEQNFVATPTVFFNLLPLENVQFVDAQTLLATVPADILSGDYTLRVVNPDTQEGTLEYDYTQPALAPVVDRVTQFPSNLRRLTIFGQNFSQDPVPTVFLGETEIPGITTHVVTETVSLRATVPAEVLSGEYALTVRNPDGQEGTLTRTFNFEQDPPLITAVTQDPGDLRLITITGANFFNTSTLSLNDTAISSTAVTYVDANTLTASVPTTFTSGDYTLKVTNPDTQFATLPVKLFFEPAPKITQVTQSTANPRLLTITGANFVATPTVYLGAAQLQSIQLTGSTTLTAVVPSSVSSGTHVLKVVNPDTQEGTLTQAFNFDSDPGPTGWQLFLPVTLGTPDF